MKKTNALRILDSLKIEYKFHDYSLSSRLSADEIASALGEDPSLVYKTLVTVSKSKEHYVFLVESTKELDLKKASAAVEEKNLSLIKEKELLPLTGYVHGGCSPIGMKKKFITVADISMKDKKKVYISGGKVGLQLVISPNDLKKACEMSFYDIQR